MNTQTTKTAPLDELRQYVGEAYRTIASMEKRLTALEAEVNQHDQTLTDIPKYLATPKPMVPTHTGVPPGYEVTEDEKTGEFYWRKTTTPIARANYGEPTYDLARVMATYHYLRNKHENYDSRAVGTAARGARTEAVLHGGRAQ
jgi:hypothetical protein